MKIQFDAELGHQKQAIAAVTGVFSGQDSHHTEFSLPRIRDDQGSFDFAQAVAGTGNMLKVSDAALLENIQQVQLSNGLAPSTQVNADEGLHLTVEMETGTGKTYVYLRTLFELNDAYGFSKFIVVVPSIAIKEGVAKTLQMTAEHFKGLYKNVSFDAVVYDSSKLSQVRDFASNSSIQILVMNIDAFRRSFDDPAKLSKANIIHRPHDRMNGKKPIEFIQKTRPIVIIDEPQSVNTTPKSQQAIASLKPLCTIGYSATHIDQHHMLYKLDAVDAYEEKLVKQIEVAGIDIKNSHNDAYIKLLSVNNKTSPISAKIELDSRDKSGGVKRKTVTVRSGADLFDAKYSGGRDVYDGYIIDDIYCAEGHESINFTSKPEVLALGQSMGGVDSDQYKRMQIRKTIDEHLKKQVALRDKGIKVLSLFFIDKVAHYRSYDASGQPIKGKYARMFEEEYANAINKPRYKDLSKDISPEALAASVHNGYFAKDKKKDAAGKQRLKDTSGKTAADEGAYHLIMKDKEALLSFSSPLQFIFSHSALREGWDNPNVFQICTLNESKSAIKKRQEIGRGLRICVNQEGQRVHGFEVNTLTVMANESYEQFAEQLQTEIEADEGIKFGVIEPHIFANLSVLNEHGTLEKIGHEGSLNLWNELLETAYIDKQGKAQNSLKETLLSDNILLSENFVAYKVPIIGLLKKVTGRLNIKNHADKQAIKLNKAVYLDAEFKALWDKIKYKTTYRVEFDPEQLITACAVAINKELSVGQARLIYRKATTNIDRGGVSVKQVEETPSIYEAGHFDLPDIITYLEKETNLTRRSIVDIITKSDRLDKFKDNPQQFIEQTATIIKQQMSQFLVEGISYQKIGDGHFYAQEMLNESELFGYLNDNMLTASKSVYEHVVYDSDVERQFATAFEHNEDIKLYAKLPGWFKVATPLGSYNPDWAVLVSLEGQDKLYFVIETKSTMDSNARRWNENAKIDCGVAHFQALGHAVDFQVADSFDRFNNVFLNKQAK